MVVKVPVERVQVGERAGFDNVGARAFTGHDAAGEIDANTDFTDGILAFGDAADVEIHEATLGAGNAVHRLEHRINRAIASAGFTN